jgi:hypothetical protein
MVPAERARMRHSFGQWIHRPRGKIAPAALWTEETGVESALAVPRRHRRDISSDMTRPSVSHVTTIGLDAETHQRLRDLATHRCCSLASVVRAAVHALYRTDPPGRPAPAVEQVARDALGRFEGTSVAHPSQARPRPNSTRQHSIVDLIERTWPPTHSRLRDPWEDDIPDPDPKGLGGRDGQWKWR